MSHQLQSFMSIAEAISLLLFPHAEVVLHNLQTQCIEAIYNNFSKREAGDASLLEELDHFQHVENVYPPYIKTNWDGRKIKSVTAILRTSKGKPMALFCINLDISKWEEMHHFITGMIQATVEKPEALFKNDWKEKINLYVATYLKEHALNLHSLTKNEMRILLLALQTEGAFQSKNAASYIADVLKISRATVYNYLKSPQSS